MIGEGKITNRFLPSSYSIIQHGSTFFNRISVEYGNWVTDCVGKTSNAKGSCGKGEKNVVKITELYPLSFPPEF